MFIIAEDRGTPTREKAREAPSYSVAKRDVMREIEMMSLRVLCERVRWEYFDFCGVYFG